MLYIFDKKYENKFVSEYQFNNNEYFFMNNIKQISNNYLLYGIDRDNIESTTGVMEYVEFGSNLPKMLKWFF